MITKKLQLWVVALIMQLGVITTAAACPSLAAVCGLIEPTGSSPQLVDCSAYYEIRNGKYYACQDTAQNGQCPKSGGVPCVSCERGDQCTP